jgi:hypothetical protein
MMAKHRLWRDEYWLLLMQLYLRKPVGVKPLYSRPLVALSLELHIHPQFLYKQMFRLRQLETPQIEQLWQTYGKSPRKLSKEVALLRKMNGFGQASEFYEGVEVNESFEKDFKPLDEDAAITPVMLIMILDLYFRLTPITMVPETPEIVQLGKLIKLQPDRICDVMDVFRFCDPYLNRDDLMIHPLVVPCKQIWSRFGNDNPENLSATAAQLKEYFR